VLLLSRRGHRCPRRRYRRIPPTEQHAELPTPSIPALCAAEIAHRTAGPAGAGLAVTLCAQAVLEDAKLEAGKEKL
jgi:hypothetical protein